ncbi:MAG: chromosome partitioning protein ParB, partial [Rhodanobacter sp.]
MTSQRKFTPEEIRQRMIANRMTVANPPSAPELANRSTIRLKITDVEPYNHNPRTKQNEKFYEIKESIRHNGIEQKVLITKRPGAASYIVAKGGNTRVLAARAVWDETQEERHLWYDFDYIEYTNEVELVAGHLRENDQRSDLCFWDRAEGYMALKQLLEEQGGKDISLREFSRILEEQGTRVSPPLLTVFRFAVDNLSGLGPGTTKLSKNDVQERIQPALASLTRLATKLQMPEAWVTTEI